MNKLREEMAQQFIDALEKDQLPWEAAWRRRRAENAVTGKPYRGVNSLILSYVAAKQNYNDNRWCTFNQAQNKSWHIRKGAKGARVEYWAYWDNIQKKLLSWREAARLLRADPQYGDNLVLRCRTYCVFNADVIEGIPAMPEHPQTDIGALREQRDTLLKNMAVGYQETGSEAYYSPEKDIVTLPPENTFVDTYGYMATLLHECGHATGHASRLGRDMSGGFGSESYAKEELRAEIASAFTAQSLGISLSDEQLHYHRDRHIAYIQNWSSILRDAPDELFKAIKCAEQISDYLIEKGEFPVNTTLAPEPEISEDQREAIQAALDMGYSMEQLQQMAAGSTAKAPDGPEL